MIARTSPLFTMVPAETLISFTTPAFNAQTSFCIFIASNTQMHSPLAILWPVLAITDTILPEMGAVIASTNEPTNGFFTMVAVASRCTAKSPAMGRACSLRWTSKTFPPTLI